LDFPHATKAKSQFLTAWAYTFVQALLLTGGP